MRRKLFLFSLIAFLLACNDQHGEHDHSGGKTKDSSFDKAVVIKRTDTTIIDTVKKSLPAIARGNINGRKLVIKYHSPAVRGRIVWGGLVPYDQVWVTGAHTATSFESPGDFFVGDKKLPAGKYAIFTSPGRNEWTVIFNKNWDQHLADEYNLAEDAVRITVIPTGIQHQERLMYLIDQIGEYACTIEMRWEKIRVRFPIKLAH